MDSVKFCIGVYAKMNFTLTIVIALHYYLIYISIFTLVGNCIVSFQDISNFSHLLSSHLSDNGCHDAAVNSFLWMAEHIFMFTCCILEPMSFSEIDHCVVPYWLFNYFFPIFYTWFQLRQRIIMVPW